MLPADVAERYLLVHIRLLDFLTARNVLLLSNDVEADPVQRKPEVSQLEVSNRGPFLHESDSRELLELSQPSVGAAVSGKRVVLPHGAVIVLGVFEFVGQRSEVPISGRFDVVVETLVGREVWQRKHFNLCQQLDDLPLPL